MPGRFLLKKIFGSLVWNIQTTDPVIFLTFDDGPIPEVTPWVLDILASYQAAGTFFCVGDNVNKYPSIYRSLLDRGHAVGNHTHHHLKGLMTANEKYFADIEACGKVVQSNLFRPPYGSLSPSQMRQIKSQYKIVMWDVLSKDYDKDLSGEDCLQRVLRNAGPGSIVVFHDSLKAKERLEYALPKVLEHFHSRGFAFQSLSGKYLETREISSRQGGK